MVISLAPFRCCFVDYSFARRFHMANASLMVSHSRLSAPQPWQWARYSQISPVIITRRLEQNGHGFNGKAQPASPSVDRPGQRGSHEWQVVSFCSLLIAFSLSMRRNIHETNCISRNTWIFLLLDFWYIHYEVITLYGLLAFGFTAFY